MRDAIRAVSLLVVAWVAAGGGALADDRVEGVVSQPIGLEASLLKPALAPMGFVVFCTQNPDVCVETGDPAMILVDPASYETIDRVNRVVNASIAVQEDQSDGALKDIWVLDPLSGDCEDFVLTKRQRLIDEGFPGSALLIVVGVTDRGEAHAVLVVRTDAGDLVLDNRTNRVRTWEQSGLSLVKMQSPEHPLRWLAL